MDFHHRRTLFYRPPVIRWGHKLWNRPVLRHHSLYCSNVQHEVHLHNLIRSNRSTVCEIYDMFSIAVVGCTALHCTAFHHNVSDVAVECRKRCKRSRGENKVPQKCTGNTSASVFPCGLQTGSSRKRTKQTLSGAHKYQSIQAVAQGAGAGK